MNALEYFRRQEQVERRRVEQERRAVVRQIYFIRGGDYVKIGVTDRVQVRMATLQASCPLPLTVVRLLAGSQIDEAALHVRYAAQRVRGEWFTFHPSMLTDDLGLPDALASKRPHQPRKPRPKPEPAPAPDLAASPLFQQMMGMAEGLRLHRPQ